MAACSHPSRTRAASAVIILLAGVCAPWLMAADAGPSSAWTVAALKQEAEALRGLVRTAWVKEFLGGAASLPSIPTRTLLHDAGKTRFYSEAEAARLSETERAALEPIEVDEEFYYNTRYGTPLAYARPLDLLGRRGFSPSGRKILDFGFGGIGQLRLLARMGASTVGIEVDPMTRALYSWPGDQGTMTGPKGTEGSLRLVYGRFPAQASVKREAGEGYDLIVSKNVLKRGYIHPEKPVPERQRIDLGVTDDEFVRALFAMLKPGGRVLIYNLSPAQNPPDKPYIPWADGRCPFERPVWKAVGFRIVEFDQDDSAAARKMAHALQWDAGEQPMNLEKDLFAHYTLAVKPD